MARPSPTPSEERGASADVTVEATPELPHWMGWSRYGVGALLLGHLLYYMYQIMVWAEPKGAPGVLAWLVVASIGGGGGELALHGGGAPAADQRAHRRPSRRRSGGICGRAHR
ncbi:MAG: hypothetical protein ACKO6N_10370 [Myxococcota bacterium]